jgi:DNA polymerase III epsilon subunit-like protein
MTPPSLKVAQFVGCSLHYLFANFSVMIFTLTKRRVVDKQKLLETLDTMSWQCFVKQSEPLSGFIKNLTGITDEMLKDDETEAEAEALQGFFDFVGDYPLYAYNEKFDVGFVNNYYPRVYMGGWYGHRGYGRRWR